MVHVAKLLGSDQRLRPDLPRNLTGWRTWLPRKRHETCGDLLERKDVIDRHVPDRAPWHLVVSGIARVLHHCQTATALDRLQARCAIVQQARK